MERIEWSTENGEVKTAYIGTSGSRMRPETHIRENDSKLCDVREA